MQTTVMGPLQADGTSTSWTAKFVSASAGEMNSMIFVDGNLTATVLPGGGEIRKLPAPESMLLDTKVVFETAADAGGQQYLDEGYTAIASLTTYPLDETVPTWYVNYHDASFSVAFTTIIDAESGAVIQALALQ